MTPIIETERLLIREIIPSDAEAMFEMDSDKEVHKYLGNSPVKSIEQIVDVIQFIRKQYTENGIGRWAVIEKKSGKFIGWTGLKFVTELTNNHQNYYDLGYRFNQKFWGMGYATESAKASLKYGLETLKLKEIYAAAHIDNIASNKILKNLGFEPIETFFYEEETNNWYKIKNDSILN